MTKDSIAECGKLLEEINILAQGNKWAYFYGERNLPDFRFYLRKNRMENIECFSVSTSRKDVLKEVERQFSIVKETHGSLKFTATYDFLPKPENQVKGDDEPKYSIIFFRTTN